ncbi:MAG: myo-inosose-2 dehydratase [Christensenellales bacterium]|jgi:inosose dehydratase
MKVRIGIAPIGWTNDDMPDLGGDISFERCISEMSAAGYSGTEIGNKYPKDALTLKKELDKKGLVIANCWHSTFILTEDFSSVEADFRKRCEFLRALDAKVIGVSEQSYSIQGKSVPVFESKYVLNDAEWSQLTAGLNRLGKIAKEYGILMTYHHHMGTVIQTVKEIDRFMADTDEENVFLLYDSGHLAYSGEDYLNVLRKYISRIRHIHLKDIRNKVIGRVKDEKLSFLDGVRMGTFTVPSDGDIDFEPILKIVLNSNYSGWLLVEAEQDPAKANPLDYAIKAKKYIDKLLTR